MPVLVLVMGTDLESKVVGVTAPWREGQGVGTAPRSAPAVAAVLLTEAVVFDFPRRFASVSEYACKKVDGKVRVLTRCAASEGK